MIHKIRNDTNTEKSHNLIQNYETKSRFFYILTYSVLVWSIFIIGLVRSFTFYSICISCSQRLHDYMFSALIRARMRFFDTNPSGRVLNRFSKDIGAVDELLPRTFLNAAQTILMSLGALIVSCVVNPILLAPLVVIALIFYWITKIYLQTSNNMKRLAGMSM